jgi:MoaA/NifB/PqqE/SkfB family radical SAM enzyme
VNRTCNLKCKHCYFRTSSEGLSLANSEWLKFFASLFADLSPSVLSFAGREIFALQSSAQLFFDVIRLRNNIQRSKNDRTEIGVITNGTLLAEYRNSLLHTPPDYFDISVEGLPETHDYVRGHGSFDKLETNLHWLSAHFQQRVWLTPTLNRKNLFQLQDIIQFYNDRFALDRFSFGFFVPNEDTDPELVLSSEHYHRFIDSVLPKIQEIAVRDTGEPVRVIFELDTNQKFLIDLLEQHGYIRHGQPLVSEKIMYDSGIELSFNIARIPVGLWRSVRISPEGHWIAAEDLLRVEEYDQLAVTTLRENDFDAKRLYHMGLDSRRYFELMHGSETRCDAKKLKVAS